MIKKSTLIVSALVLGLNFVQAQDEAKPATEKTKPAAEKDKPAAEKDKPVDEKVKPVADKEKPAVEKDNPVAVAKVGKYAFPEKKIDEYTKEEIYAAGSYIQSIQFAGKMSQDNDFDATLILQGLEEKVKKPALVFNKEEWQKAAKEFTEKKEKKEVTPELKTSFSKIFGLYVATSVLENNLNLAIFAEGFKEKLTNKDLTAPDDKTNAIMAKLEVFFVEELKIPGKKFLEENKKKEGVITLPNGLQYKVIKKGDGAIATDQQTVKVHYVGTTIDGAEFDSSVKRGEPISVGPDRSVIKGWVEIIKIMPKGSKWLVTIPEDLAYGGRPQPGSPIKPFATLIFEMELVDITGDAKMGPSKHTD